MSKTKQKVPSANEPNKSNIFSSSSSSSSNSSSSFGGEIQDTIEEIRYAFPTVSACPRCRGTNTRATSTQGRIQYRQCLSAICRERYHVMGDKVN